MKMTSYITFHKFYKIKIGGYKHEKIFWYDAFK